MEKIFAPWTPEQVAALNAFQKRGQFHPFTCGNAYGHEYYSPTLIALEDGWHCPAPFCGYRQNWAHEYMADPSRWPTPFWERHGTPPEDQTVSADAFRAALAKALADKAYECDGKCGLSEQVCWVTHPISWTATLNGEVHVDAGVNALAEEAVRVAQLLGLLPS